MTVLAVSLCRVFGWGIGFGHLDGVWEWEFQPGVPCLLVRIDQGLEKGASRFIESFRKPRFVVSRSWDSFIIEMLLGF
jgi:hypothetical protein